MVKEAKEKKPFVGATVQLVSDALIGTQSVVAAIVTAVKANDVINVVTFPDNAPGDLRFLDVQPEGAAKRANERGIGFRVGRSLLALAALNVAAGSESLIRRLFKDGMICQGKRT